MGYQPIKNRIVTGVDQYGQQVPIDALELAGCRQVRDAVQTALKKFFSSGGDPECPVHISVTIFNHMGDTGTALSIDESDSIDLEVFSPDREAIIERRTA
jgi:hypothetical protein